MKKSKILGTKNSLLFENVDAQENRLLTSSRDILYGVGKSKWIALREKYKPKAFKFFLILDGGTIVALLDTQIDLLTSTLASCHIYFIKRCNQIYSSIFSATPFNL